MEQLVGGGLLLIGKTTVMEILMCVGKQEEENISQGLKLS